MGKLKSAVVQCLKMVSVSNKNRFVLLQLYLNYLSNYVPGMWNKENGCIGCNENIIKLQGKKVIIMHGVHSSMVKL